MKGHTSAHGRFSRIIKREYYLGRAQPLPIDAIKVGIIQNTVLGQKTLKVRILIVRIWV